MSTTVQAAAARVIPVAAGQNPITGLFGEFRTNTLGLYDRLHRDYGDIALGRFFSTPVVFVFKPEYVRHILQDNARSYIKSQFTMNIIRYFSQENVFTSDGDFWLRQRRLMQPMFHRQRIAGLGSHIVNSAQAMLREWEARPGAALPIDKEMSRLTLRVVGLALFSEDLLGDVSALGKAFDDGDHYVAYRMRNISPPDWVPTHWNRVARQARDVAVNKVDAMIAARKRDGHRDDLLSMLLEARDGDGTPMSDIQVRREAQTMIAAGHETTSTALTWTFYLLSQHPQVEQRLHAELDAVLGGRAAGMEDVPRLVYARQIIDEAMRLYPPVWATGRDAAAGDSIDGYPIKKGYGINIPIWSMHRSLRYWDDPLAFKPERFAPENAAALHKVAYLPFGAGPRQCIGSVFALTEAVLILATVAQRYKLRLQPGHRVEPDPVLTLNAKYGLPMTMQPR
jgi:cytochrome P450